MSSSSTQRLARLPSFSYDKSISASLGRRVSFISYNSVQSVCLSQGACAFLIEVVFKKSPNDKRRISVGLFFWSSCRGSLHSSPQKLRRLVLLASNSPTFSTRTYNAYKIIFLTSLTGQSTTTKR